MTIKIWDLAKGNKSMATGGSARSLCYSDELLFAAYYPDCQEITAWGRLTEHDVEVQRFHADNVDILAMSKYHQKVASASSSGQVTVWETKTGAHTQLFGANSVDAKGDNINDDIDDETGGLVEKITSLAFRNSFQLACGGWETIRILNISDGTIAQEHYEADGYVELMEFSADGQWLAYKSRDRYRHYSLRIWNTATGKRFLLSVAEPFRRNTDSLSFSMDGQLLVSSSYDGIYLWDVTTGHCIRHLEICVNRVIQASFDVGIKRRLNTQFGFLTIEDPGPSFLGPSNLDANICGDAGAAAQGLEIAPCAEGSRKSSLPHFCGYGLSIELDWLVLNGLRLLRIPLEYRAEYFSEEKTPIINQSTLIWITRSGRLVRLYFPSRH
ncbi:WD40-repeat-containing domain protein [Colletotrichum acutatum]|uniref:Mitochondrial division protein 1 n=1 Tax=Glomerella acutata TaxID=27357 RepID=A0AAD8XKD0_GLOAC|nr:WD40-repeat-containing domain protein [Colletotrichum acutatum]KAK1728976.1 WD40-repeat-containing domain protein [Colletotrichum acutatum]